MSVLIISACAKDETGDMTDKQVTVPEESAPVAPPPVWYPTPKRLSGPAGTGVAPPVPPPGQIAPQAPAAGAAPPQPAPEQPPRWEWPSDDTDEAKYDPWQSGQAPTQPADQTQGAGVRRPWGAVEETRRPAAPLPPQNVWQYPAPGQPAWGTGYPPPQQAQPQQAPGTYAPYPQGYPVYVW